MDRQIYEFKVFKESMRNMVSLMTSMYMRTNASPLSSTSFIICKKESKIDIYLHQSDQLNHFSKMAMQHIKFHIVDEPTTYHKKDVKDMVSRIKLHILFA